MNHKSSMLAYSALLTAMCTAATIALPIPLVTGGYLNAGDIIIVVTALLFGPLPASIVGSFGGSIADIITGYVIFAPGTFIAKGLSGLLIGLVWKKSKSKRLIVSVGASLCGASLMTLLYFVYEAFILRFGLAAAAEIPANLLQGTVGTAGGIVLYRALYQIPRLRLLSQHSLHNKNEPRP